MKINTLSPSSRFSPVQGGKSASVSKSTATQESAVTSNVSAAQSSLETESVFDAGRVSAIKQAISEGRFSINPDAIADRLIDSARELLSSGRRA